MAYLPIGCSPIDDLIGGGIESGIITKIYGETGTGKTNICLQASRECAKQGYKVAYIDSEGVSIERLRQICSSVDYKKILKNILFFHPITYDEQEIMINKSLKIENLKLIVVDSLNLFYRINLEEDKEGAMRNFTKQVINLQTNARKKDLLVIASEQVYTDKNGEIRPFTNRDTEHLIKTVLRFEKKGVGERQAVIIKHRSQPEEKKTCFKITATGLE